MIIVNMFISFCILVKQGISFLFHGLFSIIKAIIMFIINTFIYAFKGIIVVFKSIYFVISNFFIMLYKVIKEIINILIKGIKLLFKYIYLIIKAIIMALYKFILLIIKYLVIVLKAIWSGISKSFIWLYKFIISIFVYAFKGLIVAFKAIWNLIVMIIKYIIMAIKAIIMAIYKFIKLIIKYLWIGIKYLIKVIGILIRYLIKAVKLLAKYVYLILKEMVLILYKVIKFIGIILYKFIKLMVEGVISVAIFIYEVITFIPRMIIKGLIAFFVNIKVVMTAIFIVPIQTFADFLTRTFNNLKRKIKAMPKNIKKYWVDWYNDLNFVKHARNKRDMNRQVLLIDFNSKDTKRSDKKIVWQYSAKDENGKFVKGIFEAFSKLDVHSFLMSEGYEVYDIRTSKAIEFFYGGRNSSTRKIPAKKMIFFLTQLSTYIKAGIPLTDSVRILARQEKNKRMQRLYQSIIYELIMGENFSKALEKQGEAFPKLLVNMLKTSEMTGELGDTLDDMSEYYGSMNRLKKQTLTSMMYPIIVFFFVIVVIVFIMIYVIPQFIEIYKDSDAKLPAITVITISISAFLKKYIIVLVIGLVLFIILCRFLFKKVKFFKTTVQWILMHIPVIKNVIIYNEITMFTKTFSALLQHNVFITDCMEILSKITNNEIYKMIVFDTISNIARGDSISVSFKNNWAIPQLAYEMMLTGERTGQLPLMMGKVASFYQEEQKNLVNQIKALIEPLVIVFLAAAVGLILLAVVVPMFSLYSDLSAGV